MKLFEAQGAAVVSDPFALAFVGKMWSEADLLAYAYDYEQATTHRKAPELVVKP